MDMEFDLTPNYGLFQVGTSPEKGAEIYLNGKLIWPNEKKELTSFGQADITTEFVPLERVDVLPKVVCLR